MNNTDNFILENSPEAICCGEIIMNEKGEIVDFLYDYINPEYAALTGLSPRTVKHQSMKRLFKTNDHLKTIKTFQRFMDTEENNFELYLETFQKHLKAHYKKMDTKHICAWINDVTPDKLMIQTMDEIINEKEISYRELTQRALNISGAIYGAMNIYEENSTHFRTVALAGVNENILQATKLLGFSLEKRWKEDPLREEKTNRQTLTRFNSLFDLTGETLPKLIIRKFEGLFNLGIAYVCKIKREHQTIGDFTLIFQKGKKLKHKNDLINYSQQVALGIIKKRTEKKYKSIINYSNDAIYLHGFEEDGTPGFFTEVNQKACDELGYTREELRQLKIADIDPSVPTTEKKNVVSKLFEQKFVRFETQHHRKDGTSYPVEVNTGLMRDNGREFAISIARNIEEQKKSEEKLKLYKKIVSTITDSMTFITPNMTFLLVNDTFAKFYNTTPSKIQGKAIDEVMGSDFFEVTVRPNIRKALNGEKTQYETWFKGKDQKQRYMNVRCYPYFDKDGTIIGCITHGRDMTLEKQMKDEILRNHEMLNQIIELLPGTITLINKDYEILLTSQKNEKLPMTNLPSSDDFIGKKCYELFHSLKEPCSWCSSDRVFETGETIDEETTPDDPREKKLGHAYHLYYAPVRDTSGKITGCLEYVQNITEYRKALQIVNETLKNKTEALSTISHEIRNQLGGILGFSELIRHEGINDEMNSYLDQIISSGNDLMKILEDTLTMSKFESGNIQLDLQERNLSAFLEKTYENMQPMILKRGNRLYLTRPELQTEVFLDDVRLNQVLINLLSNANKFTEKGRITLTVEKLNETAQTVRLRFSVADTGIGVPENMQQNIFQEYDQGVIKSNSSYGGTGIGLTISNKLLGLMDSKLTLQSRVGEGSVFSFVLDLKKGYQPSILAKQNRPSNLSVLIVDDYDISRVITETMLQMRYLDLDIRFAENGEEAISLYESYTPAIILLNIQIPKIRGLEVTRWIRERESQIRSNKKAIIVGYASTFSDAQIEEALETGMNDFLQKPLMEHTFYSCLEKHGF